MKYIVSIAGQSFDVEIKDVNARPVRAIVDGESFEVWPDEARPAAAAEAEDEHCPPEPPPPAPSLEKEVTAPGAKGVTAPIPGTILSVAVKAGDGVEFGQELCVLEAMKMKNSIRANRSGVIAAVHVTAGESVRHGQLLVEFGE